MKNLVFRSLFFLFTLLFLNSSQLLATDYFWVGGTGNWSDLTHWATTSGGSTLHTSLPGETDDVYFDVNSFSADGQEVNIDGTIIRVKDFIAANVAYNVSFTGVAPVPNIEIYGSFDAPSNISFELPGVLLDFNADVSGQSVNIASGFLNSSEDASVRFSGEGSWTIDNGFSAHSLNVTQGEIVFGANTFNFKNVYLWYSFDKLLNLTDATLNIEKWTMNNQDFVSIIPNNSTINFSDEFQGFGKTYGTVNVTTPTGFANDIEISGNNTFQNFTVVQGVNLLVDANTTQTILGNLTFNGTSSEVITFESSTKGEKFNFDGTGINISGEYVNISESDFLGTATFALENSLLIGDVNGWEINSVPTPTENGSFFYSKIFADSLYIDLDPGDGAERIVFMRQGGFPDITTVDDVAYTADQTFGNGELVGTDTYVVYQGSDDLVKIEGLLPGTEYSIAVREVNRTPDNSSIKYYVPSTGFSKSATTADSGNIYLSYNGTATVNGGEQFFDDGGKGFYFPNRENVLTLNSAEAGKAIKLTFNEFETRSYEELRIFDGTDTTANLITSLSGTSLSLPRTVTSTGENMTLKFTSSDFEPYAFDLDGWVADVSLVLPAPSKIASRLTIENESDSTIRARFYFGDGNDRLILIQKGTDPITFTPMDNQSYADDFQIGNVRNVRNTVNTSFGVGWGMTIDQLDSGTQYSVKIIEYNESNGEITYAKDSYETIIDNIITAPSHDFSKYDLDFTEYYQPYVKIETIGLERPNISPSSDFQNEREIFYCYIISKTPINETLLRANLSDTTRFEANLKYGEGTEIAEGVYVLAKNKYNSAYEMHVSGLEPSTNYYVSTMLFRENRVGLTYGWNTLQTNEFKTNPENSIFLGDAVDQIDSVKYLFDPTGFAVDIFNYEDLIQTFYPKDGADKLSYQNLAFDKELNRQIFDLRVFDGTDSLAPLLIDYEEITQDGNNSDSVIQATNSQGALTFVYKKLGYGYRHKGFYGRLFPVETGKQEPSQGTSNFSANTTKEGTADIDFVRGNGEKVVVSIVSKDVDPPSFTNGLDYQFNQTLKKFFTTGSQVVYSGTANSFSINNLVPGKSYDIYFAEANGEGKNITYRKAQKYTFSLPENRPTIAAKNLDFQLINDSTANLSWESGNGEGRIVLISSVGISSLLDEKFDGIDPQNASGGYLDDFDRVEIDRFYGTNSYYVAYVGDGNSVEVALSRYVEGQLLNSDALKFYVLEYNGLGNAKNYKQSVPKVFGFVPKIIEWKDDAGTYSISEIEAESFNISSTYNRGIDRILVVAEKGVANDSIPFATGILPDSIFTKDINSFSYVGFYENKRVYLMGSRPFLIRNLKPNTEYEVTIYKSIFHQVASNFTDEIIFNQTVKTVHTDKYYWVEGSGNWDDLSHWATSSGGTNKYSELPNKNSQVIFDENSVSLATKDSVVITTEEMALFSFDANNLPNKLSFDYTDVSGSVDQVNIASSFELNDSLNFFAGTLTLGQALEENVIRSNIASNVVSIQIEPSKNHLDIKDVFSLRELNITNANVSFEPQSSINVKDIRFNNSIIHNMPRWEGVNSISSDIKLPYIETANRDAFFSYSDLEIDSLFLNIDKVFLRNQSTMQVEAITNKTQKTVLLSSQDGIGNIKTNSDSLIVDNFYIKNNFALGNAVFYAKNSALLENTKGWINDNDSFPDIEAKSDAAFISGLKTNISLKLYNYLSFGGVYISLREANKPHKGPKELENLNANSVYSEASGEEQLLYLNTSIGFDFNKPILNISNLSPNTEYILSFYSCYKSGDQVIFSEDRREKKFKTLKKDDILMFREGGDVTVDGRNNLYGVNGFETGEFPFERSEITLYPNSNSKKIALTALRIRDIETDMDVSIFDGIDTSANKILESRLSARGEDLESIFQDNYPQASNAEGALTVVLEGFNSASGYSKGPKFLVYESNGVVANEPTVQASNVEISDKNQNTATITWTKGDGNRTLVSIFEGSTWYGSSFFKDGIEWNANNTFGLGDKVVDQFEQYIVYTGEGNSITIDSLKADTRYGVMALTYNVYEDEDPNYMSSDVVSPHFYTLPNPPTQVPHSFSTFEREPISTNFTFEDSEGSGALILIKEDEAVDLNLVPDSIKFSTTSSYNVDFAQLDSLNDGSRIYLINNYSDMNYYLKGLTESTDYHYAIYNYRENSEGRAVNENALTGSFKTQDGSYKIDGISLPTRTLQGDEICMGADIRIYYNYTGINEGDNSALPFISNSLDMSDSTLLDVISEEEGIMLVSLPEELDSGMHYFSMIPELGSDYKIYKDSLNIQPTQEIEIVRNNDELVINNSGNLNWFRNNELISQENDSILELSKEGVYYASKTAANCEYFSNEIYIRAKVALVEDSVRKCIDELVEIEFDNALGNLSDSFNYYTLLIDNSGNEQSLEVESIDLNDNFFSFSLPENLPTEYYSIILKVEGDSIESDTAILYIENPEPAVITVSENQLSSNYEEGNQWFFNGEPIPGATEQTVTTDRTGSYSLEVTAGSCLLTAEVGNVLSNESPFASVGLKLYPNPVQQQLSLVNDGDELGHSHVRILDAKGVEIQEFNINFNIESGVHLDVHEYANGMYFIIIESENIKAVDRFIKK